MMGLKEPMPGVDVTPGADELYARLKRIETFQLQIVKYLACFTGITVAAYFASGVPPTSDPGPIKFVVFMTYPALLGIAAAYFALKFFARRPR